MDFKYKIDPPKNPELFLDVFLYAVKALDEDDPALPFMAGLLSHSFNGGLTEKQQKYADKYIAQIMKHLSKLTEIKENQDHG